jgi:sugar lactone lactonase YvrE
MGGDVTDLAADQAGPQGVAVDGDHVYWANNEAGTICRVPKAGGEIVVIATGQSRPVKVAVDDEGVYWTNSTDDTVMKLPK